MDNIHHQIDLCMRKFPQKISSFRNLYDMTVSDTFWESMSEYDVPEDEVYRKLQRTIEYYVKQAMNMDESYVLFCKNIEAKKQGIQPKWLFITVMYDREKITDRGGENVSIIKSLSKKVHNLKHWVSVIGAVNEKHRQDGITYHTHYLVETPIAKSKAIQYVYQLVHKWVINKNSIDVKTSKDGVPYDTYVKYVNGNKQEAKMPFVEMDRKWRADNSFEF